MADQSSADHFRAEYFDILNDVNDDCEAVLGHIEATVYETAPEIFIKFKLQRLIRHALVEVGVEIDRLVPPSPYFTIRLMEDAKKALTDRLVEIEGMIDRVKPANASNENDGNGPKNGAFSRNNADRSGRADQSPRARDSVLEGESQASKRRIHAVDESGAGDNDIETNDHDNIIHGMFSLL